MRQLIIESEAAESQRQRLEATYNEKVSRERKRREEQLCATIIESKRAEEEIRLLLEITQAISESQDLNAALDHVIRKMCQATDWDFGEVWVPSLDGKVLKLTPAWYSTNNSLHKFGRLSEGFAFPPNTGLPGRVWSSKRPEWIPDVSSLPVAVFPRAPIALPPMKPA